jgi:hypothetical protein
MLRSPFIGGGGASDADRWPGHGCEQRTSIDLFREAFDMRRSGASESRIVHRAFAKANG